MMTLKQRSHTEATLGTILAMVLLFLLLWFLSMGVPVLEEDEGIEVAFGITEEGGGYEPQQSESVPAATVAPPPSSSAPSSNDLITQEDEESLALQRQREKEARRKQELADAERKRKEQAEAEARAEAERIAKEQALAEQRAKEQAAIDKANALGSLFGNNGAGATGSGDSEGAGQKGNPIGHGSIGGNDWSLTGRGAKAIPRPGQNFEQEGKVVVSIRVDGNGDVIEAKLGAGSTISDQATIKLALDAARQAKFTASDNSQQMGTITYYFKFK